MAAARYSATSTTERRGDELFNMNFVRHGESQGGGHIARDATPCCADRRCWRRVWTAGRCGSRHCWTAGFTEMQMGAADRVGPEAAGLKGVNTGRAAHHPQQKTTAAAARRKTKKISTPSPRMSRDGTARSDCTSTRRTLRVCLGRKWCLWMSRCSRRRALRRLVRGGDAQDFQGRQEENGPMAPLPPPQSSGAPPPSSASTLWELEW